MAKETRQWNEIMSEKTEKTEQEIQMEHDAKKRRLSPEEQRLIQPQPEVDREPEQDEKEQAQ